MSSELTNVELLNRWHAGDEDAARRLVDRYLVRLTALARSRLSRRLARRIDAEDVVLSAWRSFFVATGRGRVTVPADDDLWPLLVTMTLRKLSRQAARHQAEQRDIAREQSLSEADDWAEIAAGEPTPADAAALIDELEHLLAQIPDQDRQIVSRRLRGDTPRQIASELDCAERTVRRAMARFRRLAEQRAEKNAAGRSAKPARINDSPSAGPDASAADACETKPTAVPTRSLEELLLQQLIGQGGFGKLYRAHDRTRNQTVAVKFLRKSLWNDRMAVAALIRETQIVSRLAHSAVIRHHGWGRTPAGGVFIVMDWIDGEDLSRQLSRSPFDDGEVIRIGICLADALATAHAAGIVHGDLTPANVLRTADGAIVLTDFGFSAVLASPVRPPQGGTPGFLAPEQISDVFGPVTEQTDVYGLGGLLFALLTGHPPMTGCDTPEILAGVLSSEPVPDVRRLRPETPPKLAGLIGCCLAKEKQDRPPSIHAVHATLQSMPLP